MHSQAVWSVAGNAFANGDVTATATRWMGTLQGDCMLTINHQPLNTSRDASFISYAGVNVILTLWSPPTKCCEWLHVKSLPVHEMVWCTHARYRTSALIYQTVRRYMVHVTPTTQYNVSHGSVHSHSINQTKCVQPYRTLRCWWWENYDGNRTKAVLQLIWILRKGCYSIIKKTQKKI